MHSEIRIKDKVHSVKHDGLIQYSPLQALLSMSFAWRVLIGLKQGEQDRN